MVHDALETRQYESVSRLKVGVNMSELRLKVDDGGCKNE